MRYKDRYRSEKRGGSGVRTKFHRLAGLLLALVLMISGICGDALKADAAFMRAPENTGASCVISSGAVLTDARGCTVEMLGTRRNTDLRPAALRCANQRRGISLSSGFLCLNFFSLKQGNLHTGMEETAFVPNRPYELVTDYMHRSDGKKRI